MSLYNELKLLLEKYSPEKLALGIVAEQEGETCYAKMKRLYYSLEPGKFYYVNKQERLTIITIHNRKKFYYGIRTKVSGTMFSVALEQQPEIPGEIAADKERAGRPPEEDGAGHQEAAK